jgi:hypothetical protein
MTEKKPSSYESDSNPILKNPAKNTIRMKKAKIKKRYWKYFL